MWCTLSGLFQTWCLGIDGVGGEQEGEVKMLISQFCKNLQAAFFSGMDLTLCVQHRVCVFSAFLNGELNYKGC